MLNLVTINQNNFKMKKIFFIMIALLSVSAVAYAAFPTQTESNSQQLLSQEDASSNAASNDIDWGLAVICS